MHRYLRAIGFSNLKSRLQVNNLLAYVIQNADEKKYTSTNDMDIMFAEYSMDFAENLGITVRGEFNEENQFVFDYYFPYSRGTQISSYEDIDPSREQLAFPEFKTRDGESANDTNKRMNDFFNEILEKYKGKRIAVISHGGAIKFYLLSFCKVNERLNLEYKENELAINSPCLLKMTFRKNELVNLEQMKL